jgi:phosphate transport system permease protein
MDPESSNPFAPRPSWSGRLERIASHVLRGATYAIVFAAAYLFLHIAFHGSKVVFQAEPPFINTAFLTEKPQTLHVFEPRALDEALGKVRQQIGLARDRGGAAAAAEVEQLRARAERLEERLREGRRVFSDREYRALPEPPAEADYVYETYAYSGGGIGPAIVGTVLLVAGSIAIALVLGIVCAIYLSEYGRPGRALRAVRLSVLNLSGVPSIVFGLFGFGLFVHSFGWGVSMIAGWFTLALMALPVIIAASEESMRSVPAGFREGSLALGATKWTSIRTNVLPYALPGILTSSIMGVARVAGETAPIMFTAAYALRDQLPWEGLDRWHDFFFQGVMALPYHIYVVSTKIPQNEHTRAMQYGSAFVFLVIVGFFALSSILLRSRIRRAHNR